MDSKNVTRDFQFGGRVEEWEVSSNSESKRRFKTCSLRLVLSLTVLEEHVEVERLKTKCWGEHLDLRERD